MTPTTAVEKGPEESPVRLLLLTDIEENGNVRQTFSPGAMNELVESVREHGVLQPILVRPMLPPQGKRAPRFSVVAGHRRFRAAHAAGHAHIPAIVREILDESVRELQLIENIQREELHPLEEAEAYQILLKTKAILDVAKAVGKSQSYIFDRMKLMDLVDEAKKHFRAGTITVEHAVKIARLKPADQKRVMEKPQSAYDDQRRACGLFRIERTIFDGEKLTARSPKELQSWIDENIRLDRDDRVNHELFPAVALNLMAASNAKLRVVSIIKNAMLNAGARSEKERTFTPATYRAVGKKECKYQAIGVVVAGPGRGESFPVCTSKDRCETHWKDEMAARRKDLKKAVKSGKNATEVRQSASAAADQRYEREREKRNADLKRWENARPAFFTAMAAAIQKDKLLPNSPVGQMLLEPLRHGLKDAGAYLKLEASPEGILRMTAMVDLMESCWDVSSARPYAKAFGIQGLDALIAAANNDPPDMTQSRPKSRAPKRIGKKK